MVTLKKHINFFDKLIFTWIKREYRSMFNFSAVRSECKYNEIISLLRVILNILQLYIIQTIMDHE